MVAVMAEYTDLILVLGVGILALTFPAIVSAFSRGVPPRSAMITFFLGGLMVLYANSRKPEGYSAAELPQIVMKVISGV